jgi:hypothetical protein
MEVTIMLKKLTVALTLTALIPVVATAAYACGGGCGGGGAACAVSGDSCGEMLSAPTTPPAVSAAMAQSPRRVYRGYSGGFNAAGRNAASKILGRAY